MDRRTTRASSRSPRRRRQDRTGAPPDCTGADLFDALWASLADVIGPTAAAALLQRSVKRAAATQPELDELVITRDQFEYIYTVPRSWMRSSREAPASLRRLAGELWPLLAELTGQVVVRRLGEVPLLQRCGVVPEAAEW